MHATHNTYMLEDIRDIAVKPSEREREGRHSCALRSEQVSLGHFMSVFKNKYTSSRI